MKRYLVLFLIFIVGCQRAGSLDASAVLEWSQQESVATRETAAFYHHVRSNGRAVVIATAYLEEDGETLTYNGGRILDDGFLIYPGSKRASNIHEAIGLADRTSGASYELESIHDGSMSPAVDTHTQ